MYSYKFIKKKFDYRAVTCRFETIGRWFQSRDFLKSDYQITNQRND